jgi:hypothetical protein
MRTSVKKILILTAAWIVAGCGVRHEDQAAWVGVPVAELEKHPVFITMRLVRSRTTDGTEILNYVNGTISTNCAGIGALDSGFINFSIYQQFVSCQSRQRACNNIFYVRDGRVTSYVPVGSGGARCYTSDELKPGFRGSINY